ncbi:TRAP transporter small permease [Brevibacillus ruminantium]|uniref:TRAP transporter small permease n=1 Tax=Brevibacillus ruminantium TaxID=2950604 RepID=A0ABY4WCV9_9BACL|nr:TRAP transporter small permease [Brevibacillus ruminantium]USG65008.1 TRAP transporter small permease [Brevibacillus ruminantium]
MSQFFRVIRIIEDALSGSLFILAVLVSLYGIVTRYILEISQFWATEIYTLFLVWGIFIGFGTALRDDAHISIDLLYDRFPEKWKKVSDYFVLLVGFAFSLFFIITGLKMVATVYIQGGKTLDVEMPMWIPYLSMPVGGLLLFTHFLEKAMKRFAPPQIEGNASE